MLFRVVVRPHIAEALEISEGPCGGIVRFAADVLSRMGNWPAARMAASLRLTAAAQSDDVDQTYRRTEVATVNIVCTTHIVALASRSISCHNTKPSGVIDVSIGQPAIVLVAPIALIATALCSGHAPYRGDRRGRLLAPPMWIILPDDLANTASKTSAHATIAHENQASHDACTDSVLLKQCHYQLEHIWPTARYLNDVENVPYVTPCGLKVSRPNGNESNDDLDGLTRAHLNPGRANGPQAACVALHAISRRQTFTAYPIVCHAADKMSPVKHIPGPEPMSILPSPPHLPLSPEPAYPQQYTNRQPDPNMKTVIASSWRVLEQPPPPTLREILEAYKARGDGDREMLLAMLNAKSSEDQVTPRILCDSAPHNA
ncbi:hypothetical protein NUW54_g10976 [Trametes sanguinea]|uniref:Uncharacterized protein n=1 Tax=Trametes sanguinea TaxID=158606 RepID=A0ACC1NQ56_9APHY|nr:hypothetical protein NUW54_g10976 [Trametes sanguinea]